MASRIFLADCFGEQTPTNDFAYKYKVKFSTVVRAIIAKGNIIEGIEAKE